MQIYSFRGAEDACDELERRIKALEKALKQAQEDIKSLKQTQLVTELKRLGFDPKLF